MTENRVNKTVGQLRDEIYQDQRREKEQLAKSIIREQMERRDQAAEIYAEEQSKLLKLSAMSIDEVVKAREDWKRIQVKWPINCRCFINPTNYLLDPIVDIYADEPYGAAK